MIDHSERLRRRAQHFTVAKIVGVTACVLLFAVSYRAGDSWLGIAALIACAVVGIWTIKQLDDRTT